MLAKFPCYFNVNSLSSIEPRGRHGTLPSTAITWSNDQPARDEDLYERLPNSSSESEMFSQGHGSVNNTNGVYTIPTKAQGGSYATVPMQMEFEGYRDDFSSADQQRGHQHTPYANPKLTSNGTVLCVSSPIIYASKNANVIYFQRNILVYYCKCCNLIG